MSPSRPATKVGKPAAAPARPGPAARGGATRHGAPARGGRPAAKKQNPALIIGAVVGVLAIGGLGWYAMRDKPKPEEPKKAEQPKTPAKKDPTADELIDMGNKECAKGYEIIQSCGEQIKSNPTDPAAMKALKAKLQEGAKLITDGLHHFEKATTLGGQPAPKREWIEARKLANMTIPNLGP